jgi:chaperone modulatory protein CbpM
MKRRAARTWMTPARRQRTLLGRSALRLMSGVSERQLLLWEHERWIEPVAGEEADEPLYEAAVLGRIRVIRTLSEELEVNLPGIDVILNLLDQIAR